MQGDDKVKGRFTKGQWWKEGLSWGLFMFVLMSLLFPLVMGNGLSFRSVMVSIPLWMLGGLGYGYSMHLFFRKKTGHVTDKLSQASTTQRVSRQNKLTFNQRTILIILLLLLAMGTYFFVKSLARPEQWRMIASSVSLLGFGTLTLLYLQHLKEERKK